MTSLDRSKLAKLLGMLGSSFDGEVLNAAKLAQDLVTEAKLTWYEVLGEKPEKNHSSDFEEIIDWRVSQNGNECAKLKSRMGIICPSKKGIKGTFSVLLTDDETEYKQWPEPMWPDRARVTVEMFLRGK